jgi:hypothetical protein
MGFFIESSRTAVGWEASGIPARGGGKAAVGMASLRENSTGFGGRVSIDSYVRYKI